jgi:DNA-binding MarR family transcriptional regulator
MAENQMGLASQLCFAVYSTAHAFGRVYKPLLDALQLTYPQYLVMLVLWEKDGLSVKALGEKLMLDSGTLTPLLKRLEKAGFVQRRRSLEDERKMILTLSPAGLALREKAATSLPPALTCATGLDSKTNSVLRSSLDQLRANLLAHAADATADSPARD